MIKLGTSFNLFICFLQWYKTQICNHLLPLLASKSRRLNIGWMHPVSKPANIGAIKFDSRRNVINGHNFKAHSALSTNPGDIYDGHCIILKLESTMVICIIYRVFLFWQKGYLHFFQIWIIKHNIIRSLS